ncbi:glycosyltransferase family 4 protein [Desulfovibrio inopinatus]|uniref:glycosyltransferase family 4 protein n=1 Tax=Desulfovibrio inopinatus TaxID=102109 RepID=UPI000419A2B8|nr:glycosyltransferase [Desulfovibrio inopinatus]
MSHTTSPLRLFYAAGPGDVVGSFRHFLQGRDDPAQTAVAYSTQFFEACRQTESLGLCVSSHDRPDTAHGQQISARNMPRFLKHARGALWHGAHITYGLRLLHIAAAFQADVAFISEDTTHFFIADLFRTRGIMPIPTLHNTLWTDTGPKSRLQSVILRAARPYFSKHAISILSASRAIRQQVEHLTDGEAQPIMEFLPLYRHDVFSDLPPPDPHCRPFRVLFAGRIEANKGIFDLVQAAALLKDRGLPIAFDICGTGAALPEVKRRVDNERLGDIVQIHGHLSRPDMMDRLGASHVVAAPTTPDFNEGFNQSLSEAVLAGRPVIATAVNPALEQVAAAAVVVPPYAPAALADAITDFVNTPDRYVELCHHAQSVAGVFRNPESSFQHMLLRAIHLAQTLRTRAL